MANALDFGSNGASSSPGLDKSCCVIGQDMLPLQCLSTLLAELNMEVLGEEDFCVC